MQTGYNVIAENIEQARKAAEQFRKGDYNIRDVPKDAQEMSERVINAARQFSTAAIEAGGWLLNAAAPAKPDGSPAGSLKLTVRFRGAPGAKAHTRHLARPKGPTSPKDITVRPLETRDGAGRAITEVHFLSDLSVEGLVAEVEVPARQKPGVYSGMVYAKGEDVPLGVLTIEIPPAARESPR